MDYLVCDYAEGTAEIVSDFELQVTEINYGKMIIDDSRK